MPHPLRSGSMAQHEAIAARHLTNSPVTPPSPNIEQLVRGGEAMRWHPPNSSSSSSSSLQQRDTDCEHTPLQKKSVLAKVKEKAKKWGRSLSKKKHNDDGSTNNNSNTTPSWGVSLDDEDDDEPEYLGAPLYESEVASGRYKNVPRQQQHHPAVSSAPLVLEKQVSSRNLNASSSFEPRRSSKSPTTKMNIAESIAAGKQPQVSPVTLAETLKEKPSPPPPQSNDDATEIIPSKVQNVSVSTPGASSSSSRALRQEAATAGTIKAAPAAAPSSAPAAAAASVTWKHTPAEKPAPGPLKLEEAAPPPVATKPKADSLEAKAEQRRAYSAPVPGEGAALDTGRTNREQIWDKGVSVKEYIMNKLEPGEDAKALSRVISQAMSPRKAPGDAGVVEKVKEVVSSLWQEDTSSSDNSASQSASSQSSTSYHPTYYNPPSSPHIPISTNSTEVEEENQGRILQAN